MGNIQPWHAIPFMRVVLNYEFLSEQNLSLFFNCGYCENQKIASFTEELILETKTLVFFAEEL